MLTGLFLTLLALVGIIAIMVWIVQLPFVALLINIGLIALAAWIVQGPLVAMNEAVAVWTGQKRGLMIMLTALVCAQPGGKTCAY
jgi:hypothetical protein